MNYHGLFYYLACMISRTSIEITELTPKIQYNNSILSLGSCFSAHIGNKLYHALYDVDFSLFGTLYHPGAIYEVLKYTLDNTPVEASSLIEHQGQFSHWSFPHTLSHYDAHHATALINNALRKTRARLHTADTVILTLGTAIVYRLKETESIVANCHKMPGNLFTKYMLSIEEITSYLDKISTLLLSQNDRLRIILTVSPVRHIKDGMVENTMSKARLIEAVHTMCKQSHFHYFPSYEIMIDDLRDYRYYTADMIHPSDVAIDYIWKLFEQKCLDPNEQEIRNKVLKLASALQHRPIHPESEQHQKFLRRTELNMAQLKADYPFLDVDRLKS